MDLASFGNCQRGNPILENMKYPNFVYFFFVWGPFGPA
jgi:hypothetical protein